MGGSSHARHVPVEPKRVQECRQSFHQQQHADGEHGPRREDEEESRRALVAVEAQADLEDHVPQHFRQLCSQAQCTREYIVIANDQLCCTYTCSTEIEVGENGVR